MASPIMNKRGYKAHLWDIEGYLEELIEKTLPGMEKVKLESMLSETRFLLTRIENLDDEQFALVSHE